MARQREFHSTPKHGSWRNPVAIEFAALSKQCLDRRIGDIATVTRETAAWTTTRTAAAVTRDWQFRPADARVKLRHRYPTVANPSGR